MVRTASPCLKGKRVQETIMVSVPALSGAMRFGQRNCVVAAHHNLICPAGRFRFDLGQHYAAPRHVVAPEQVGFWTQQLTDFAGRLHVIVVCVARIWRL
jgi:hypothetical protein